VINISKGDVFTVSKGIYSAFRVVGIYIALKDFDLAFTQREFEACASPRRRTSRGSFLNYLINHNFVNLISGGDLYLGERSLEAVYLKDAWHGFDDNFAPKETEK
jgi:hypothetical protein